MLEAFARGVNDGIKLGSRRKAHEFAILRASPTPFTAVDSIAISKLICFGMASNWDVEMARLKIARDDGKDALLSLDPTYPEWPPVSHAQDAPSAAVVDRLAQDLKAWGETVGVDGGSNNWVIGASRTSVGRPIIAGDPHLPPHLPTANPLVIASMRMLFDVGAWDESRFSMPGGQSGNPFSPHYDDLLRLWRRGGGVPIVWSEDRIQEAAATTLRLLPEPPSE